MLLNIYIADLTMYSGFVYYPVREVDGDCIEPITDGTTEGACHFTVYGRRYEPSVKAEVDEPIVDTSTLQEAATYCLMLNASLQGRTIEFVKPEQKDAPEAPNVPVVKDEDGQEIKFDKEPSNEKV